MGKAVADYSIKDEYTYKINDSDNPCIQPYINDRLLAQIIWYDKRSKDYQKKYKQLSIASTILSACIPVLTLLGGDKFDMVLRIIISTLSGSVSVIAALLAIDNAKELWVRYRSNCEILKSILHRYYTNTCEFCSENKQANFELLVNICEEYFTNEFKGWGLLHDKENQSSTNS